MTVVRLAFAALGALTLLDGLRHVVLAWIVYFRAYRRAAAAERRVPTALPSISINDIVTLPFRDASAADEERYTYEMSRFLRDLAASAICTSIALFLPG